MKICAVNSAGLYSKTNSKNENLKSSPKFYSNSVQPNDQLAFTGQNVFTHLLTELERKEVNLLKKSADGVSARLNLCENFIRMENKFNLMGRRSSITEIIFKQSGIEELGCCLSELGEFPLLSRIILVGETTPSGLSTPASVILLPTDKNGREKTLKFFKENVKNYRTLLNFELLPEMLKTAHIDGLSCERRVLNPSSPKLLKGIVQKLVSLRHRNRPLRREALA